MSNKYSSRPSRRSALKLMLAAAGATAAALLDIASYAADDSVDLTHIPASVMFHARDTERQILPQVIDTLLYDGYTFTTYSGWVDALRMGRPIERPVIFTFDDLTLTRGSANFAFYARIVGLLRERGVPAVFSVVTEPVVVGFDGKLVQVTAQDDAYWQTAAEWSASGIELATHTQAHKNLDSPWLNAADLEREIGGSAAMIAARLGQPVRTLVTPFGSGVTQAGTIAPLVLDACAAADIQFVVGIAGMRQPVLNLSNSDKRVHAVGRIMPNSAFTGPELAGNITRQVEQWVGVSREDAVPIQQKRQQRPDAPVNVSDGVSGSL